jgi:hypothetical protein
LQRDRLNKHDSLRFDALAPTAPKIQHDVYAKKTYVYQMLGKDSDAWLFSPRSKQCGKAGMTMARPQIVPLIFVILTVADACFAGIALSFGQERDPLPGFETCKIIAADQARLDCLKKLLPGASSDIAPEEQAWRLIRTPRPNGGPDAVAIMRTADTAQSDADLAGLMLRCQERPGLEVVLALVRPLPPRSKRDVVVKLGTAESILHGETSAVGTALVLPVDATAFTTGPFREQSQLSVKISDPESDIRGVIPLDGVGPAIAKLSASCLSG